MKEPIAELQTLSMSQLEVTGSGQHLDNDSRCFEVSKCAMYIQNHSHWGARNDFEKPVNRDNEEGK